MKKAIMLILIFIFLFGCIDLGGTPSDTENKTNDTPTEQNQTIEPPPLENDTVIDDGDDEPEPPVVEECVTTPDGATIGDQIYTNKCDGTQSITYKCENNEVKVEVIQCERGNVCIAGECKKVICYDDDNADPYKNGTTFFRKQEYKDSCSDGYRVREYSCDGDELKSQIIPCDIGCTKASCIRKSYTCDDPDDLNLSIVTNVTENDGYTTTQFTDSCYDIGGVKEYFCNNESRAESKVIRCADDYFCQEGICVREQLEEYETVVDASPDLNCWESDFEKDYGVRGWVKKGLLTWNDKCVNDRTIEEYYCKHEVNVIQVIRACPDNKICDLGRCK